MFPRPLLVIFLVVFIDLVGFGIVIPILPYYAQHYGASGWEIGWLFTAYSLLQFVMAPVWGRISDWAGRRPILLLSIFGSAFSYLILSFSGTLQWVFIARLIAGACAGNISTAYAYVADVTSESDRAKGMGLIGAGFGLGFVFGPAIGGVMSRFGHEAPMYVAAAMGFVNFVLAVWLLAEPRVPESVRASRQRRLDGSAVRRILSNGPTAVPIAVFFLVTMAVAQLEVVFAIYMKARYDFNAEAAGGLLAMMGTLMLLMQGVFIGRLKAAFGERRLILAGIGICSVALAVYASTLALWLAVAALCFLAVGHGALHPSLSSLVSIGAAPQEKGVTMGLFHSGSTLARVLSPPLAGWLYDNMSWRSPFLAGTIFLLIAFGVMALSELIRRRKRPSPYQDSYGDSAVSGYTGTGS